MLKGNPRDVTCHGWNGCHSWNGLGIYFSTFNRIMPKELRWHPYQIFPCYELTTGDFIRSVNILECFNCQCGNPWHVTNLVVDDEKSFALNGKVNKWNVREYTPFGNPPQFHYDVRILC